MSIFLRTFAGELITKKHNIMGKLSGISGMMRGRVGSMVYSKGENGATYVRQYQPQVFNPRTDSQLMQRAKMNLAGQISSLTSRAIVRAMSAGNNRKCRGLFVNRLLRNIEATQSGGDYIAAIDVEAMVFSRGSAQFWAEAGVPTLRETILDVPLHLTDSSRVSRYGERIVVVSISPRTVSDIDFITSGEFLLDVTTEKTCSVTLPHPLVNAQKVYWFRCPFELKDSDVSIIAQKMAGAGSEDEINAIISSHVGTSGSIWGDSVYGGKLTFTQA